MMELQLGLALPTHPPSKPLDLNNKRSFSQLFEHPHTDHIINTREVMLIPTLSLLPLTPDCSPVTKNDIVGNDNVEAVVGWPPVKYSFRKKLRYDNYGDIEVIAGNHDDQMVWIRRHQHGLTGSNTLFVKVKMEGVEIARKVNLRMHHSFHTLKETLMEMFGKFSGHHQHSNCYQLAYQDREGDWLLADDVPWRSFIQCARRLKLVKNNR